MLLQGRGFFVAGKTDLLLGHCQAERGHVALGLCDVADRTRGRHRGMYRAAGDLPGMAGTAIRILRNDPGMFHSPRRECRQRQNQKRNAQGSRHVALRHCSEPAAPIHYCKCISGSEPWGDCNRSWDEHAHDSANEPGFMPRRSSPVRMSGNEDSGPTAFSANLTAGLVKDDVKVKAASCMKPEMVAGKTRERTRKPPETHSRHRLCDRVKILAGDRQTAENQSPKSDAKRDLEGWRRRRRSRGKWFAQQFRENPG